MGMLEKVNAVQLDPELMKRMLDRIDAMGEDQRSDITGRGIGLIRFLENEGIGAGGEKMDCAYTIVAFEFRMEALARLRDLPEYKAWAVRVGEQGEPYLINEVLVETAAVHPLIEVNVRPEFEPTSFFRAALLRAEAEGNA